METQVRRMPTCMLDHLQHICARQDQQFIGDVARILGLSADATRELRRKILGVVGTPTIVATESNPWWMGTQCPIMTTASHGMKIRCGNMCTPNGRCWKHRTSKKPVYTDPEFKDAELRTPFRVDGDVYWIGEDGRVYDTAGNHLKDVKVNLKSRVLINLKDAACMGICKSEPSCSEHATTRHEKQEENAKEEVKMGAVV